MDPAPEPDIVEHAEALNDAEPDSVAVTEPLVQPETDTLGVEEGVTVLHSVEDTLNEGEADVEADNDPENDTLEVKEPP